MTDRRGAILGLLLYGHTEGLWQQERGEQTRVLGLDRVVDLVGLLGRGGAGG